MLFCNTSCATRAQDENVPSKQNVAVERTVHLRAIQMETWPYPEEARKKGIKGKVTLVILVGVQGTVAEAEVMSGPNELRQAALASVRMWQFEPPIDTVRKTAEISYGLPEECPGPVAGGREVAGCVRLLDDYPAASGDIRAPELPVIDHKACPGDGRIVSGWKIERDDRMYSSFEDKRTVVGKLKAGEEVTVLGGANVVREPDTAIIKYVGPSEYTASLKVGDVALGYGVEADANVLFWAKGTWFREWIETVAYKGECGFTSGFGRGGCVINIVRHGISEWWVQVKTSSGLTGWVLAEKFNGDEGWSGNFSDLCHYGED